MKSLWMRSAVAVGALFAAVSPHVAMARTASDYVKCDGKARDVSIGEGLARLTVIIGTMGLAGSPETDNVKERLYGEPGITACDAAMADGQGAAPGTRRALLMLGRAIHQIEAGKFQAAIDDAHAVTAAAGAKANDHAFQRSVGLSALNMEAFALVHMGRPAEAEAVALRMAQAEPLDILSLSRAQGFMLLTRDLGADKRRFYHDLVRLDPGQLIGQAQAEAIAGDFAAAARCYESIFALAGIDKLKPTIKADAAVVEYIAGNMERADRYAALAREQADALAAGGPNDSAADGAKRESISHTDEMLDILAIFRLADGGKAAEARTRFTARSRWLAPSAPVLARITAKLRQGATPAELSGALARDPDQAIGDVLTARAKQLSSADMDKALFTWTRPLLTEGNFSGLARGAWTTTSSRWLVTKTDNDPGQSINVPANGTPAGEALLLHAALLAKANGKAAVLIYPPRLFSNVARVSFVDTVPEGVAPAMAIPVAEIVAALTPDFPMPAPTH
jgi:tetratricopeptide (TPR) repeat protein